MNRLLHALVLGLVGAGLVHIAILFMLPSYSANDAWTRISAAVEPNRTLLLGQDRAEEDLPTAVNPFITAAACRFDLSRDAMRVRAPGRVPFWSMSVYDSKGLNVFSINDRVAKDRRLDFVVLTPLQMQHVRARLPSGLDESIFVETETLEGVVIVRVFTPDETWRGFVSSFLETMRCEPVSPR